MFRTVDSGGVPRLGRDIAAAVAGLCGDDTEGYNIGKEHRNEPDPGLGDFVLIWRSPHY
jgi:hypothetical protein